MARSIRPPPEPEAPEPESPEPEAPEPPPTTFNGQGSLIDHLNMMAGKVAVSEQGVYHELVLILSEAKVKIAQVARRVSADAEHIAHEIHDHFQRL